MEENNLTDIENEDILSEDEDRVISELRKIEFGNLEVTKQNGKITYIIPKPRIAGVE